jgi:hypothetical protein
MVIKRPRISLEDLGIVQETPVDRRSRIETYQNNAQSRLDRINEHEAREDARLRRIEQKVKSGELWLDMSDLDGQFRQPVLREDVVPQTPRRQKFLTENMPTDQKQGPQRSRQVLAENVPAKKTAPAWTVQSYLGETRSGNTIPVWKVSNLKSGRSIDKLFRIEEIAHKVARFINESSDPGDPRAVSLIAAYDKRDKLLKEARLLEKDAAGKPMKTERLRSLRAEINQLEYRLGI